MKEVDLYLLEYHTNSTKAEATRALKERFKMSAYDCVYFYNQWRRSYCKVR